jgi:hypothetical protein
MVSDKTRLIFVDTEGAHPTPEGWTLREFGAVDYETRRTFHGKDSSRETFVAFSEWLVGLDPIYSYLFVTDNIAYDWPPIHYYFMLYFKYNPFGHSARRIGDFYAGLMGDFWRASDWKRLRKTKHDHNPVNDAMGNVEAFEEIMKLAKNNKL